MLPSNSLLVPSNLQQHGLTQSKPFVPQFMHEFGIDLRLGRVNRPDRFQQGEWQTRIERPADDRCRRHNGGRRHPRNGFVYHMRHYGEANVWVVTGTGGDDNNRASSTYDLCRPVVGCSWTRRGDCGWRVAGR